MDTEVFIIVSAVLHVWNVSYQKRDLAMSKEQKSNQSDQGGVKIKHILKDFLKKSNWGCNHNLAPFSQDPRSCSFPLDSFSKGHNPSGHVFCSAHCPCRRWSAFFLGYIAGSRPVQLPVLLLLLEEEEDGEEGEYPIKS